MRGSVLGVAFALGLAASAHAQMMTLLQDGFSGGDPLGGSSPDTVNRAGTTYTASDFNRNLTTSYSSSPVAISYSGNNTGSGTIGFTPVKSTDPLTVSGLIYLRNTAENHQPNNGFDLGFTNGSVGGYVLAGLINRDGSGTLSGGGASANFSAASTFVPSNGTATAPGMVGLNNFSITYNPKTDLATLTEAGTLVASINAGSLTLGNAGFGGTYINGFNNYKDADGIDNFAVAETVPEPATYATGLVSLGLLLVGWKRGTMARA